MCDEKGQPGKMKKHKRLSIRRVLGKKVVLIFEVHDIKIVGSFINHLQVSLGKSEVF